MLVNPGLSVLINLQSRLLYNYIVQSQFCQAKTKGEYGEL